MYNTELLERLQSFVESEGKSCSFDPEVIVVHGSRLMATDGSWFMVHESRLMVS